MRRNSTIVPQRDPEIAPPDGDILSEVLRHEACELLQHAVEAEVAAFIKAASELQDKQDRQRIVPNG